MVHLALGYLVLIMHSFRGFKKGDFNFKYAPDSSFCCNFINPPILLHGSMKNGTVFNPAGSTWCAVLLGYHAKHSRLHVSRHRASVGRMCARTTLWQLEGKHSIETTPVPTKQKKPCVPHISLRSNLSAALKATEQFHQLLLTNRWKPHNTYRSRFQMSISGSSFITWGFGQSAILKTILGMVCHDSSIFDRRSGCRLSSGTKKKKKNNNKTQTVALHQKFTCSPKNGGFPGFRQAMFVLVDSR